MNILRESIEGYRTNIESSVDWPLVVIIMKLFFVLCFKHEAYNNLQAEDNIEMVKLVLERAIRDQYEDAIIVVYRFLSFFMESVPVQHQLLDNPFLLKSIFDLFPKADGYSRKFYLSCLVDLFENPRAIAMMQNTSWTNGIEMMLNSSLTDEPLATSVIFNRLYRDSVIQTQVNSMMSKEYIDEVLNKRLTQTYWLDPSIPAHLRRISASNNLAIGNMNISIEDQYDLIKSAFEDNFRIASSNKERRPIPILPKSDLNQMAENFLYFSPAENTGRRPPSHRDNNLPKVKAGSHSKEPRQALTKNNIDLLKMEMPGARKNDLLGMAPNKNFIQSFLNNINKKHNAKIDG